MRYVSYKIMFITIAGDAHSMLVQASDVAMAVSLCYARNIDAYRIMYVNRV